MMKRIVVADDHPIVRRGLILILSETDDMTAIAAASHDELLSTLRSNQVEAVVMNIGFERSGIDGLRGMKKAFPLVPVLMFNTQADDLVPIRALRAGASGYIQKESSPEELIIAIRRLLAGGTYLSAGVAERIASNLSRGDEGGKPHERLSKRELEVFRDLGVGNSVGEIAEKLKLSVKTVSTHRARILEKTGLKNNADIIRYAITQHLV